MGVLSRGSGKVRLRRMPAEEWANSWKRHFKPIEIGSSLLIRPSWSRRAPRKGAVTVQIDPGLSFGTGQHPTTAFCLRQLVVRRRRESEQSVLDAGTGSGILAIAAAKLGYSPIDALDSDPNAIQIARANARQNGVSRRIRFLQQEINGLPRRGARRYALVCANLVADLLINERDRLLLRLEPDGVLVIAGVLDREFSLVQSAYERAGLKLIASRKEREWRSGAFERAAETDMTALTR
jgi:ribosomal protein L11 methyltransferase